MKIIKQKRKSLTLKIDTSGELIVKAPLFCSRKQISDFVEKHQSWINKQAHLIKKNKQNFSIDSTILYLGKEYKISQLDEATNKVVFDEQKFYITGTNPEMIRELFIDFFKKQAKIYLSQRLIYLSKELGLEYNKLRITSAKTRRGSCTSKRNINLSRRLMMAPAGVIDYVILHELAHLTYMNHSKNFWGLVDSYMNQLGAGDYIQAKKWLRRNSIRLSF